MRQQGQGFWAAGTVVAVGTTGQTQIQIQRDGQVNPSYATAQYSNPAVGDRVTVLLLGQQLYATGLI